MGLKPEIQEDNAWLTFKARSSDIYDDFNYDRSLQAFMMRASHRLVEKPFKSNQHFSKVLEIGAGTGEHLAYVRHKFDRYIISDIDLSMIEAAKKKLNNKPNNSLSFDVQSANRLTFSDDTFDRLIAVHVLEHINLPHVAIKEWYRVLKNGAVLSILIPTDPGVAWRLGRHLGPRKKALAQGIAYDYIMAREHVNACTNLIAFLRYYFPNAREYYWPTSIPLIDANLFVAFQIVINKSRAQW